MKKTTTTLPDDGYDIIYRPCITLRNGRKIWAHWYGKRVFRIRIKRR